MRKFIFTISMLLLLCAPELCAQKGVQINFDLAGVVRNEKGEVIPNLALEFHRNERKILTTTDINGEFKIVLHYGDYVLTANDISQDKFRVFITIRQNEPNPEFLKLVARIDLLETDRANSDYPKVVKYSTPDYPPAARAIRAGGEVEVKVSVDKEGKVTSAKAVSGHPLLRPTSVIAARAFEFDPANIIQETEVTLRFVFMISGYAAKDIPRYNHPYRVFVHRVPAQIHQSISHASVK
ncbi:MAG: TonB family protein [Acidobacteria bacterium]|nr:TonB family protein [Acidobacteriota bacterium]